MSKLGKKIETKVRELTGWSSDQFSWYVEQPAHFFMFSIPCIAIGPLWILFLIYRELTKAKIGKWKLGQWPPGKPYLAVSVYQRRQPVDQAVLMTQMDRVEDLRLDLIVSLAGCIVGTLVHEGLIVWLLLR